MCLRNGYRAKQKGGGVPEKVAMGVHAILPALIVFIVIVSIVAIRFPKRQRRMPSSKLPHVRTYSAFALVCESGSRAGTVFALQMPEIKIGRAPGNHVLVEDRYASRYHAFIRRSGSAFEIIDNDSSNGVWVNGHRIYRHKLCHGDVIKIGATVFRFVGRPCEERKDTYREKLSHGPSSKDKGSSPDKGFRFEDYVLEPIPGGTGGQARVYKAVSRKATDQVYAVKIFYNPDPYTRQKFDQVTKQLMQLHHPNIVRLLGFGKVNEISLYLLMEYLAGGSLRDYMEKGIVPLPEAVRIVGQVCEALYYAHRHGIIHRDIKPENILFTVGHDFVKLIDFSAAHFNSEVTVTQDGLLIGTPFYMSFEQAKGEKPVPASDLYSLGIVLFEMLTGRRPFEGNSLSVIEQHIRAVPPDPRRFNHSIPPHISKAILKSLEKDYKKRFKNAMEFANALGYEPRYRF